MRAQDDEHYIKLVTDFIKKFGKATREDIDKLLSGKLSDALDDSQKVKKIGNLLTKMRRSEIIANKGSRTAPEWIIAERMQKERIWGWFMTCEELLILRENYKFKVN